MTYRIKLRRSFMGQDGWGAFCEEVAVSPSGALAYRNSSGGNCDIGTWNPWQSQSDALRWMLGFQPSPALVDLMQTEVVALPDIEPTDDGSCDDDITDVNYGEY